MICAFYHPEMALTCALVASSASTTAVGYPAKRRCVTKMIAAIIVSLPNSSLA
jgi:hypothetical protein